MGVPEEAQPGDFIVLLLPEGLPGEPQVPVQHQGAQVVVFQQGLDGGSRIARRVQPADERPGAGPGDSRHRDPLLLETLEDANVGDALGAASPEGQDQRPLVAGQGGRVIIQAALRRHGLVPQGRGAGPDPGPGQAGRQEDGRPEPHRQNQGTGKA